MYKFKYREIHNTGELTVVQVQTFINFLTSEFSTSTRGERDTHNSYKSFVSYHANKTQTLGTSRRASDLLSSSPVGIQKTQPYALTVETQTSQHHGLNSTSTVRLHGPSRLITRPVTIRQPTGLVPSKLPTRLAHSRDPTDVFFKIAKFSAHCFRAWRHSHSSPISYLGFIMTVVIVISSVCERKLYPMSVHLN